MLEVGSLVNGVYKILNVIGRGGMSVVYLAINERANKTWAIKEVRKDGSIDSDTVIQGLAAETEMLKTCRHPNLPSIVDVIDTEDSFIIVMDYIEGESLDKVLRDRGGAPIEKERVLEWAKQLCDVLNYLHTRETPIIYRDMKPNNIMLRPDDTVSLIDFGTARQFKANSGQLEDTTCLGTVGYAAPEQYQGSKMGQTNARTDIYCLGATMYHLLTGHSPVETPLNIPLISQWIPEYEGTGLEKVVAKCTRQSQEERYRDCSELMYALEHIHEEDDIERKKRERRWRWFMFSCVLTVIGIIGMAGFAFALNQQKQSTYESYIAHAEVETDQALASSFYQKAIALDATRKEAYNGLLGLLVERDADFTSSESALLNSSVGDKLDRELKTSNPQAYDEFVYRLANYYYFFYDASNKRIMAANWFEKILDSENLSAQQMAIVNSLYTISNYYQNLGTDNSKYDFTGEHSASYKNYWDDLVAITDGDLTEKTGQNYIALGLYKEFAVEIYNCNAQFKAQGITQAEIEAQLDKIMAGLDSMDAAYASDQADIDTVKTYVQQARNAVESTYTSNTIDQQAAEKEARP